MDSHKAQEFIGVDLGSVRVGLARGNSAARIAEPVKTVPAQQAISEILEMAKQNKSSGIVVGLPRSLDGSETHQTKSVRSWASNLRDKTNLQIFWQDEALSSINAETDKDLSNKVGVDALAAAVILQDFLDSPEDDRVTV